MGQQGDQECCLPTIALSSQLSTRVPPVYQEGALTFPKFSGMRWRHVPVFRGSNPIQLWCSFLSATWGV
jgi:hypothetical protein